MAASTVHDVFGVLELGGSLVRDCLWTLKYLAPKCFLLRGAGRSASVSLWMNQVFLFIYLFFFSGFSPSSVWDSRVGPSEVSDGASMETVSLDDVSGAISVP